MHLIKKHLLPILLILFISGLVSSVQAEPTKFIALKDGSVLKGEIVQFYNGVYTVWTEHLGQIDIPDEQILSISSEEALLNNVQVQNNSGTNLGENLGGNLGGNQAEIMGQVQQLQGNILSDPEMMQDISTLLQDEEVVNMLSDQNFIKDIMSFDPNRLEGNPKTQELMQNPAIQNMMKKMDQNLQK